MKKYIALFTAVSITALTPLTVAADTIDTKINESTNKITELKNQKSAAERELQQLDSEISHLENEISQVLAEKVKLEKEINTLREEIAQLEAAIEKRTERIKDQARSAQVSDVGSSLINAVFEADNISDAVTASLAYMKVLNVNKEIVEDQKRDQEALEQKESEMEKKLELVNQKQAELNRKQESLTEKRYDQAILAKEVAASLTKEESKKAALLKEKEEAEARKREAERLEKERREKEAKARAEAEKQAAALAAKQAKAAEEAAEKAQISQSVEGQTSSKETQPTEKIETFSTNETDADTVSKEVTEVQTESKPAPSTGNGYQSPLSSLVVTSPFGPRVDPTGTAGTYHDGIDFAGSMNQSVFAAKGGSVVMTGFDGSAGNYVIIKHDDGMYTYYLHLNQGLVSAGQSVSSGTVIGLMGTTGNSTGVHLHFGMASTPYWSGFVNPASYLGL